MRICLPSDLQPRCCYLYYYVVTGKSASDCTFGGSLAQCDRQRLRLLDPER